MSDTAVTDWWNVDDVARYLGVAPQTVRAYMYRNPHMPRSRRIGIIHVWRPEEIKEWHARRPSRTKRPK